MSISRKFQRSKSKYTLGQKIISAVTAAGFIMQPFTAFAGEIIKPGGNNLINNGVANIWADKVVGEAAVNVFEKYNLSANEIANMYFKTQNGSEWKNNLVNFVNSRIDINGTVNAIQNNQIGGNLFFLSKDGMAVGKSGVINTGSLYVMTPTQGAMEDLQSAIVTNANNEAAEKAANALVGMETWQAIPVNPLGTITVLGKVKATNDVQLRAAKIGVGKNVDDAVIDNVAAGEIAAANAYIETGIEDFSNFVNLTADQQKEVGLTTLTAKQTGNGDIVLSAYTDQSTLESNVEDIPVLSTLLKPIEDEGEGTFVAQTFEASVDVYGTVDAAGKADISATAVNSNADVDENGNYVNKTNSGVSQLASVNTNVNIGGTVEADKDVNVKAEAINRYVDNSGFIGEGLKLAISSGTPLAGDVAYSALETKANVNIKSGAAVTSTGGNVDIDAKAETLAASAASTLGLKFKALGGYTGANVPAAAVVYTGAENSAAVNVDGDVTAAKNVDINADAKLTVEAENKMTLTGEKVNQVAVGVTVVNAKNNAAVNIGTENNASVVHADGDLNVKAAAQNDFTSNVSISVGESSAVGVAVNVTDFDSSADVNVDSSLTAGGDLSVNADNTVEEDNVTAETKVGSGKYMSSAMQVAKENGSVQNIKDFVGGIANDLGLSFGGDDVKTSLSLGDVLKAGATVTVSNQNHNSGVTIGNMANLNANGKLDIGAQTLIKDAHMTATGATYSYNDATSAPIDLNAAVLVSNMQNNASVVVEDAETTDGTTHNAQLAGEDGVNINASTRFEYNRINNMISKVTDAAAQIENAFKTLDDAFAKDFGENIPARYNELKEKYTSAYETFKASLSGVEGSDETLLTSESGSNNVFDAVVDAYNVLTALEDLYALTSNYDSQVMQNAKEIFAGASDIMSGALAFADPNSYGNFAAVSQSKGSSGDTGGSAPGGGSVVGSVGGQAPSAVNGAGSVMVIDVDSVSKVEIGSGAAITSSRDVNLNAENYMKDVSLGGLNNGIFNNKGGGTAASIGATVNYSEFDTDTIITVNDGAVIKGGNIGINADNEIDHVSVAASAGKGPSSQTESSGMILNGMLSFVNGSSDILTVVDDGATLEAEQNEYTEDNAEKTTEGSISITGRNDTSIVNVAAGASWGHSTATMGVGLAYTDFEVKNITGVADVASQMKNITIDNGVLKNTYQEDKADENEGSISAYGFAVDAATEGSIQSVSAAGTLSNDVASGQIGFFDKTGSALNNLEQKVVGTGGLVDKVTGKFAGEVDKGVNGFFNMGSQSHGSGGGINVVGGSSGAANVNTYMPEFSLAGSGSVSINMLDNATQAVVDNADITMKNTGNTKGDISVTARNTSYTGAYSGAAAIQWNAGGSASDKSVAVSGAAGVNDIDNVVKATISNSRISNAGKLDTMALSGGEQLALGLGMTVVKADGTSGYSGNAAGSVNLIDHNVEALLENNTVNNTDDINVAAYARDIESTGGGSLSMGQQKGSVGASIGVAQLNNNISAGIRGGSYTDVGSVDVEALNALQNITVGIAAGVTLPTGDSTSAVVSGAGVYNEVHNTTNAFIEGSGADNKAVISTLDGGSVNVTAQDVAVNENSVYEQALAGLADGKAEIAKRMGSDFDYTGKSEMNGVDMGDVEDALNGNNNDETAAQNNVGDEEKVTLDKTGGSSIITVSGVLAGTSGSGAGGAAVAVTDIENNYTANVEYADITAEKLNADAGSDSNIVTVSGGIAAANKGAGVGSVTWNDVDNTAKANIANSVVKAQSTTANAANTAQIVSVAGQISGAGKAGVGATLSYIGLDNSTEANITNTDFDKRNASETEGITVSADAQNSSDSYNVAAGVSAAGTAAVSGNVAVTQTHGTTGAVIDGSSGSIINNAQSVSANAVDDTDILSVIGTVSGAGTASVGAGVAYTEIGSTSTDEDDAQQTVAEIKNYDITTAASGSTVSALAKDSARIINAAVGIGGAGTAAVQGASATSLVNKTTAANVTDTNIDEDTKDSKNANVTVKAVNDTEITSSADVAAVAGTGAGVGAGVAVNRVVQNTQAALNGGTMNVNNLTVSADGTPRIENIGIGIGAAGTGGGVTGNVSVNMIQNDVTAHIGSGANIVADGSVGVVATSDEQIANYAGSASVAGTGAGVGVSVSVNQINGITAATIGDAGTDTKVAAKGNSSLTTDTLIKGYEYGDESQINNTLIDDATVGMDAHIEREKETRSGLIVDASSTRDLKSFLINAAASGTGAGASGTVNVNMIKGATNAGITDTIVNGGSASAGTASSVFVNAGDYTNSSGFVGGAAGTGVGAGVGLASDTNTVERLVSAVAKGSDIKADSLEVKADSEQGVSSLTVTAGIAGVGAGIAGSVSVTELKNKTYAKLINTDVDANEIEIAAQHTGVVNAGNVGAGIAGVGAGIGLSVGVLKDNSETVTEVSSDTDDKAQITAGKDVNITAKNTAVVNPLIAAGGVGVAGVAGATSINNINSVVKTDISGVNISGGNISGSAQNNFTSKATMGTLSAGGVGAGVGVTVNTIDSTVQLNVENSGLNANENVTLTADEVRDITQYATGVAAGVGAVGVNVAITTVGQLVDNEAAKEKIDEANAMYTNSEGNDINSLMKGAGGALGTAGITNYTPTVGASTGAKNEDSQTTVNQITVNIKNTDVKAGKAFKAEAKETDNIAMTLGSASAGGAAVAAGTGILNVHRNTGVNISGGSITADTLDVGSTVTGEANLNVYQGALGALAVNGAYAAVNTSGNIGVELTDVELSAKDINVSALDNAKTTLNAISIAGGLVGAGALVAEAANDSDISVTFVGNTVTSDSEDGNEESGNINISTNKANTVAAEAVNVAGGAIGGAGMGATVSDNGSSVITLVGNTMQADKNIDVAAQTNSVLTADINNDAAGVFASGAISIAEVNAGSSADRMVTAVNIGNGNTFAAQNTNIGAASNITQSVDLDALSISGYVAGSGNTAAVNAYTDVGINVVKENAQENSNTYKGAAGDESSNVSFDAENSVMQTSSVSGVTASGLIASGTNIGKTNSDLKTNVDINGSTGTSSIGNLTVNANSKADVDNSVNGDGGSAIGIDPYAAQSSNNITSNTTVNMAGSWNIAGDMDVNALHSNNVDIIADALKASVVGYSGVHSDSTITNNTAVNFNNANITTGGSQDISARNTIDYDSDVTGSGYGVIEGAAVFAKDVMEMNAAVNLDKSTLTAGGAVDISALTGDAEYKSVGTPLADVNKEVTIKSAGVVAGTYAESTDDITFTNNINVGSGSSIATVGDNTAANADIILTAADRTNFSDVVTADTQGGVIGAAGSKLTNDINRTNKISIGGAVDSNYDANFDAGDTSVLNLTLKSNAYNKTAAPLATNPSINGVVTQNSAIDFASGSTVKSFRNINAAAGVGDTTVAKESKTWRWVDGGETGTGSISSTSDGTISSSDAVANTTVTVDGTLEAGKNHKLEITIDYVDNGGKVNLENAINKYGETLATGSLKTFEDAVTKAEEAYNAYLKDTGLNNKINELSALEDKYDNISSVYRDLNNEYGILTEKLANEQTSLEQAEANLTQAEAAKSAWIKENCAKYNDENNSILTEIGFEAGLKLGYYKEYQAGYQEQVANVNDCTSKRNAAQTTVETLKTTTESKYNQMQLYDTTQISKDIADLRTAITNITNSDEYKQNLAALQKVQEDYNAALAEGVSADKVNEVVFANKEGDYINVGVSDWFKDNPVENIGMADYAAALLTRYNEITDMMQDYTGTDVSAAYSAELSRIQGELQALGIGYIEDGTFIVADGASTVPTIELTNLAVSGGNVNITGGTLDGGGTITANGMPSVTVTNNTDFFLHVNDVTVESDGGSVLYNNASVNVGTDNKYNGITVNANKAQGENAAQITITNTADKHTTGDEANIYTPDIGIYGTIYNPFGNITITNEHNSIYVAGEVTSGGIVTQQAGSIKGRTINLTAGGSITQGYSDDIRNVAGSPEDAIRNEVLEKIQAALIAKLKDQTENGRYYTAFATWEDLAEFLVTVELDDEGTTISAADAATYAKALTGYVDSYTNGESSKNAIVAGGAIYINAASINVNGTIQSGYESYKLDIDQTKIQNLMQQYTEGATPVDDSKYMTYEYLVTNGSTGAYYDSEKGEFVYGVQAWYNPTTNQIFTEDIDQAGGGRIYLTGAIANTNANGGKLVVLDGGSNYKLDGTVNNTNDFTFKLGSINADTVAGRIEINDTSSGKTVTTVYTKDSVTVDKDGNRVATYNPEEGLYYNWSNGTASRVITSYKHVSDSSWWGLSSKEWEDKIGQMDQAEKDSMRESQTSTNGLMDSQSSMITDGKIGSDYQYIEVDGSSEKTGNDNIYQISFQREGKPKQAVAEDGKTLLYLTKDEDGNDIITTEVTDRPCYVTTTDADGNTVYVYETEISDKVTTTKKKGLLGLWGKTVTTTWKETSGMITAYDFSVKADNKIGIEFVGNSTGSIGNITSNGNILLGGDINMGSVDIISTAGNINHLGDATVISDNATFNAATGIDVIQKNVDKALHLNAVTTSGDINIQAIAANANNMVYIDNVSTGKGNVSITAEGSLLNGKMDGSAVITGNGITLQSYNGTIGASGTEDDRLVIDGGTAATNAYANGGIYLTEATGNMYLGEIVSENGDVVLAVKGEGAGFVDAIKDNSNGNLNSDRVEEWTELGLLGGDNANKTQNNQTNQLNNLESAASSGSMFMTGETTLAEARQQGSDLVDAGKAFAELMKGGSEAVQAAREDLNVKQGKLNEAIAAIDDSAESKEAYKNALEAYNKAYDVYAEAGAEYEQAKADFIANSKFADNPQAVAWLNNYEAVANAEADNYGWTEQQLMYAVQDSVINPNAGSVSDVKTANVTGNNITFISDTGNLGVVDTQGSSIESGKLTDLFTGKAEDETGFLEKLASARAGDVTWGKDEITVQRTTPVSVKLNGDNGTVTVVNTGETTADHVYLLAKDSVLNANEFAANDLRLSGQQGINVNEVTGNKIILEGGSGDIGHKVNDALQAVQVTLNNNGYISANAAGNIMLQQAVGDTGNFTLGSVAGTNVDITANGNIVSKTDDIGYINAGDTINLVSIGGGVGTDSEGLRIKNSGAVVNTNVQKAVNIEAVQDGTLILGTIEQANGGVKVESEGTIMLGREDNQATDADESVTGYIDAKGDVSLHAAEDIFISGKLHVNAAEDGSASNNGTLNLHADNGSITQTTTEAAENIITSQLNVAAVGGDVLLDNAYNVIKDLNLQAVGGSLAVGVTNPDGFTVDMGGFTNKLGGDIKFTNNDGSVNINTWDVRDLDITDPAQRRQDPATINGRLIVTAKKGTEAENADITNAGVLNATGNIKFTATDGVIRSLETNAKEDIIMQSIEMELEKVLGEKAVTLTADKTITVTKLGGGDITATAGDKITVETAAGKDITLTADNLDLTTVTGTDDVLLTGYNLIDADDVSGKNVTAVGNKQQLGTVTAQQNIRLEGIEEITADKLGASDIFSQAEKQELKDVTTVNSFSIKGDTLHVQTLQQKPGGIGSLVITTESMDGSGPIETITIDKLDAVDKAEFTQLWAEQASVTTTDVQMDIDKMIIEDFGEFTNTGTKVVVFGQEPQRVPSDVVFWYGPERWSDWMYLYFTAPTVVESNGTLVSLRDYWDVYDQRFTAENHLRWQHGRYLDEDYEQNYGYGLSLHNRYGLIDYQDFEEENAGEDEIAVDA